MRMSEQKLNLKFVQEVEKHQVLYNYNLPGYSRKDLVEQAWREISEEVNLPIAECKEKWRNVRTVLIRKRKPSPKGSQVRRKAYYLADAMKFCLPFIKIMGPHSCRRYTHNIEQEELSLKSESFYDEESANLEEDIHKITQHQGEQQEPESIFPEYFASKRARHEQVSVASATTTTLNEVAESSISNNNNERKEALKMFLLSVIPEVETFSDNQIKLFKRKIFSVIDEISGVSYNNQ